LALGFALAGTKGEAMGDDSMTVGKPARILVVDDDPEIRALLQRYLQGNGMAVRTAHDARAVDVALSREPADIVVLDLMLPGEDGLSICRRLRATDPDIGILMLTARGDPVDRIIGLEMGADDYIAKPFTPRELLARIHVALRRAAPRRGPAGRTAVFGPFTLDLDAIRLERNGALVALGSREFAVLAALAANPGRPLSRAQIIDRAFSRDAEVTDRAVDVQIARLRKAIETDPADPIWIRTVWGVGYVLSTGASQ
jgi:two-component system phosphate regulon response regulator OmpR